MSTRCMCKPVERGRSFEHAFRVHVIERKGFMSLSSFRRSAARSAQPAEGSSRGFCERTGWRPPQFFVGRSISINGSGGRGKHLEGEAIPLRAAAQKIDERRDRALETNATTGFHQVFTANAAKFRVVPDQIGGFAALLYKVAAGQPRNTILKCGNAQFTQDKSRILETSGSGQSPKPTNKENSKPI